MDSAQLRRGVGLITCGLSLAVGFGAGPAAADPTPVPDPAVPFPAEAPPVPVDPFAAASVQSKDNPVGTLAGLLGADAAGSMPELANRSVGLTGTPPADPLAGIGSLMAENFRMPSGEEVSPYVLQTNVPPGPFARVNAFKGAHALGHAGLGRVPRSELGQPLPGTAPAPGTNLPPGLEQYYVPPEAPADVPATGAPVPAGGSAELSLPIDIGHPAP